MTADELSHALRQLRLGGMADSLTIRAQQARAESLGPLDFLSLLIHDELFLNRGVSPAPSMLGDQKEL